MRVFTLLFLLTGFSLGLQAQSRAMEGITEYQKTKLPAAVLELPYPPELVENAIEEHFRQKGHKSSKAKDFMLFRQVRVRPGGELFDAYVKTEKRSRREKAASVVYMVLSRPNELISTRSASDKHGVSDAREFLDALPPHVDAYSLNLELQAQEELIKKLEKKYADLVSDSTDLYKRKQQLDEKILANSSALKSQVDELEKEKQTLEAIRSRKKQ